MLVSVIIPTYGRSEFVIKAIQSIAAQTYDQVELIVVDDHSPEPVAPVLERVDTSTLERARVLRHDENRGANAARNTGIRASNGDIVAFLDDDDQWQPTLAERYVEAFEEADPEVGLVSVGVQTYDSSGKQIGGHLPKFEKDPLDELLDGTLVGSFSRFAVKRWAISKAGLPNEQLPSWQDWEWQFRLARHCRFASIPEPLILRTQGGHEQITDDFDKRRDISYPLLISEHSDAIAATRGQRGADRFVALLSRALAASALRAGRYRTAIWYLFKSLRYDPKNRYTYFFLLVAFGGPLTNRYGRRMKHRLSKFLM